MKLRYLLFTLFAFSFCQFSFAQIYVNDFGPTNFTAKPYTGTPGTFATGLSASSWTTSAAGFAGFAGSSGASASLNNSSGTPTMTLTFSIAAGYQMSVASFNFWRVRSNTGAQNWSMTINGIAVGTGTIPTAGAAIGNTTVSNAVTNITGTATIIVTFSGASGAGTCRLDDFTLNGTVTGPQVDYCNLQSPGSISIDTGNNATFYAQAYEPGVTDAVGQGSGIAAWIGYSTSNTDPSSGGWTWFPATYNVDFGNNDEYMYTFINPPVGVHYVASRFQLSGGSYTYGGYTASGGGFWDTTNVSGVLIVNDNTTVDFANLQSPATGSFVLGGIFNVYAQVYEPLITAGAGMQGAGITAWIGYSPSNTDPSSGSWAWVSANFNSLGGGANNDEYSLDLGGQLSLPGTYYYASRFQLDAGVYRYGGILPSGVNGGFWDGTTYISGVLTVTPPPSQEIYVKAASGGLGAIADGSTAFSGLNNTSFGTTAIGSTIVKDFQVGNEGTGINLTLTGTPTVTISGTNPGDFTVTAFPAMTTIAPGASTTFNITFSPLAAGDRFATVNIINNDTNENPYNFDIKGTGTCAGVSNTIAPFSGPVGTEVTVTAASGNLTGATATFNGVTAVITQISSTVIKVVVPSGAASGMLLTTNSQGCTVATYFTVLSNAIGSCQGNSNARGQLFISEVTDHGSGSHSFVEIYNATGGVVNIQGYSLRLHNNGASTPTNTITFPNVNLANNAAYVVAFGGTDATSNPGGVVPNLTNTASGINDNDNIRLYNNLGIWIDQWGDTSSAVFTIAGKDYVYRRKNLGITAPSTTWNPNDWVSFSPVNYTNVGLYDFSAGVPPTVTLHPSYSATCKSMTLTVAGNEGFAGSNPLAFEWYYLLPGATVWTAVPNTGVYSGANTQVLTISDVAGLDDYQFYCQIQENTTTCYAASDAVKIPTGLTVTWNGTAWTPAAGPTTTSIVAIDGPYDTTANGSFDACSVTVKAAATLTITSAHYVSIENDLTVNANGFLHVLDDGSLVMLADAGIVTNNGTMDAEKTTTPFNKFDYTYWSSPVAGATIGAFTGWRTDYAFLFDTVNFLDASPVDGFDDNGDDWQSVTTSTGMVPGKGYAIMGPTSLGSYPAQSTVLFSGAFNNGVKTVPLALNAVTTTGNDDFNLVGNPYPSAISADDFITLNTDFAGALYFWTHRTPIAAGTPGPAVYNFVTDDYATYTWMGLAGTEPSNSGSSTPSGFVASGQGFFIEAISAGSITFNNSMRKKTYDNSDFFRNAASNSIEPGAVEKDRIWLNMQNEAGLFSQQLVGYADNATLDFDRGYDGLVNRSANTVSFYSFIGEGEYRIQGRPAFSISDVVPLGFSTKAAGTFTISIDRKEGRLNDPETDIYLEDRLLNIIHDLKQTEYAFTTETGTFNNRFLLRYTNAALGTPDFENAENNVVVAASDAQIKIRSYLETLKSVTVYDITGRQVFQKDGLNSNEFTIADAVLNHQALVLKIVLANGQTVSRKIVF